MAVSRARTAVIALLFAALAALLSSFPAGAQETPGPAAEPPAGPTGLAVETEQGSLDVSVDWDDVGGASRYWVRWRVAGPGNQLNEGVEVQPSLASITVDDYGEWVVRVQACNDAGCGSPTTQRFTVEQAPEPTP